MFTTITTSGTPRGFTLDDVAVELFFPNNDTTAAFLDQQVAGAAQVQSR